MVGHVFQDSGNVLREIQGGTSLGSLVLSLGVIRQLPQNKEIVDHLREHDPQTLEVLHQNYNEILKQAQRQGFSGLALRLNGGHFEQPTVVGRPRNGKANGGTRRDATLLDRSGQPHLSRADTVVPRNGQAYANPASGVQPLDPGTFVEPLGGDGMIGQVFGGDFRIEEELGKGGMGVVYRARQQSLDRLCVLKTIQVALADEGAEQRFRREATLAASLRHPAIVEIYARGHDHDQEFYVMEQIEGTSLQDVIKHGPLDQDQALEYMLTLTDALAYAHEHGVIHRDLKPDNIMITAEGRLKILDFGLAKALRRRGSTIADDNLGLSHEGMPMGSPGFMSPEQANGDIHEMDALTDVYGLGATFYALLTGESPISRRGGLLAVLDATIHGKMTPLRERNPSVDPAVAAICMNMLAKEREDRYPNMRAVSDDIKRYQNRKEELSRRKFLAGAGVLAASVLGLSAKQGIDYVQREAEVKRSKELLREKITAALDEGRAQIKAAHGLTDYKTKVGHYEAARAAFNKALGLSEDSLLLERKVNHELDLLDFVLSKSEMHHHVENDNWDLAKTSSQEYERRRRRLGVDHDKESSLDLELIAGTTSLDVRTRARGVKLYRKKLTTAKDGSLKAQRAEALKRGTNTLDHGEYLVYGKGRGYTPVVVPIRQERRTLETADKVEKLEVKVAKNIPKGYIPLAGGPFVSYKNEERVPEHEAPGPLRPFAVKDREITIGEWEKYMKSDEVATLPYKDQLELIPYWWIGKSKEGQLYSTFWDLQTRKLKLHQVDTYEEKKGVLRKVKTERLGQRMSKDAPVYGITKQALESYARWLSNDKANYRLLTKEEFEALQGNFELATRFPDGHNFVKDHYNHGGSMDSGQRGYNNYAKPVRSGDAKSVLGFYQLGGNAAELVKDKAVLKEHKGKAVGLRGGFWGSPPSELEARAHGKIVFANKRSNSIGGRLAIDLVEVEAGVLQPR